MISDYKLRKKYHYCVTCGKQDSYTLNGRARCYECNEEQNAYQSEHPEYAQRHKERLRRRYKERRETGMCTRCGKRPASPGKTRCDICLAKDKIAHRSEISRTTAAGFGLCYTCLKNPCKPGYKVCPECYDKCMASLEIARANITERKPLLFGRKAEGGEDIWNSTNRR